MMPFSPCSRELRNANQSDREAVTREAADRLVFLFSRLLWRGVERWRHRKLLLCFIEVLWLSHSG